VIINNLTADEILSATRVQHLQVINMYDEYINKSVKRLATGAAGHQNADDKIALAACAAVC
jgi:hypothetical protein